MPLRKGKYDRHPKLTNSLKEKRKKMKKVNIVFGNHNTVNAIEDYIYFLAKTFSALPFKVVISKEIIDDADILVMQEDFKRRNVKEILEYKKDRAKKLVVVATENISGDSFNDNMEVTSILDKRDDLERLAEAQVRAGNWPTYLLKKYILNMRRDFRGFRNIIQRVHNDHLGVLKKRHMNFLKVGPKCDQVWIMPGLKTEPYQKLFGSKVAPFHFVLSSAKRRDPDLFISRALLSGKISYHRRCLLNFLDFEELLKGKLVETKKRRVLISSFDTPLSVRWELLKTAAVYLDLPVSEDSKIFSSMKAAIAIEAGAPFFSLSSGDPGRFGPFCRTFEDIRSLKDNLEACTSEDLVELGANFSAQAVNIFSPSAYPFLQELTS